MTYSLDALGDFMQVGPQVYPERPNGVQVIMRGPHGARFAADPVRTREGQPRGSGFRTWVEQITLPQNEAWVPQNKVVGLLGLAGSSECPREKKEALTKVARSAPAQAEIVPDQVAEAFRATVLGLMARLDDCAPFGESGWTDRGSWDSSQAIRSNLQAANANLNRRLGRRDPKSASLAARGDVSVSREFTKNVVRDVPGDVSLRVRECAANPLLCVEDPTGEQSAVRRGYGGGGRPMFEGLFSTGTFAKLALLGGAGLAVYALASGYGKGLATRGRKGA